MMKIKDLPEKVGKIAKERVKTYRNLKKMSYYWSNENLNTCFDFTNTPEGKTIWHEVDMGKYENFYKFHNLKVNEVQEDIKRLNNLLKKL